MSRPRRRGRFLNQSIVFVVLVSVSCGFALTAQAFTPTTVVSKVNLFVQSGNDVSLTDVSCAAPGYCGAIGDSGSVATERAIVASSINGKWSGASPVRFPASSGSTAPKSWMGNVSCHAHADCTAVGQYQASSGPAAFTVTSRNGVWGDATPVAFPVGMIGPIDQSWIQTISCWAPGDCVAVGYYLDSDSVEQPFTVQSTAGKWSAPIEASFGTISVHTDLVNIVFAGIDCVGSGTCTAVGSFTNGANETEAMILSSSHDVWSDIEVAQFANGVQDVTPSSHFSSVSCPKAGDCVAVGSFMDATGGTDPMIETSTGGTWTVAEPTAFPAGVQNAVPNASFTAVSCSSVGDCVAVGQYLLANEDLLAFSVKSSNGTWSTPVTPSFDPGVKAPSYDTYTSVSCPTSAYCVAAGMYDASSNYYEMVDVDKNGSWAKALLEPVGPSNDAALFETEIFSVSCAAYGNCSMVGNYENFPKQEVIESTAFSLSTVLPPSAPLGLRVVKSLATSVTVSWRAPANNGYAPITAYRVTASGSSCTTKGSLSCTIYGLKPSSSYEVRVAARNRATYGATTTALTVRTQS